MSTYYINSYFKILNKKYHPTKKASILNSRSDVREYNVCKVVEDEVHFILHCIKIKFNP